MFTINSPLLIMRRMNEPDALFIRPMLMDDLDAVIAIEQASFRSPWSRDHFRHEIDSPSSFPLAAVFNGRMAGYVCLMSLFEDAQILDIAVAPDQRGKGVGALLLDAALKLAQANGAQQVSLEVRASNCYAISLYERFGFTGASVRKRYYDDHEDAVVMVKSFSP